MDEAFRAIRPRGRRGAVEIRFDAEGDLIVATGGRRVDVVPLARANEHFLPVVLDTLVHNR